MGQVVRLSDIYCQKQRERTTAQLRAEVAEKTFDMELLIEFVAEIERAFDEMLSFAGEA